MELVRHSYRYYPYELELARREVGALLPGVEPSETANGFRVEGEITRDIADRLVYFAGAMNGRGLFPTVQARLEQAAGNGVKRQSTRYSAHGLHDYKGKFNPQIARAILNILRIPVGANVLDPFCGSGTTLLECAHMGMNAIGTDINPLAVFIANSKLDALRVPAATLRRELDAAIRRYHRADASTAETPEPRRQYLLSWFDADVFETIERLRLAIDRSHDESRGPLLSIASNLLREYSLQDPNDLRIRRRKTPIPDRPFVDAFTEAAGQFLDKLEDAQSILGEVRNGSRALILDSVKLNERELGLGAARFDCALTSPPYATALPYIDTQRLSLVWLGLIPPSEILPLEARLVGSREVRGRTKQELLADLKSNRAGLPELSADYCRALQAALSHTDGFRRQALPLLLYRYFAAMASAFRAVRPLMKDDAPFALIVGFNHTVLGGKRFDIDTPMHLAAVAAANGWRHMETVSLQTYSRFGYHMNNAVTEEGLIILRAA